MSLYNYRAKKGPQELVEATVEALSKEEAMKKIEGMGYFPINIEQVLLAKQKSQENLFKAISSKKITIITRQLATLIKSGVPILRGLEIIFRQIKPSYLKSVLENIYSQVKEGQPFSAALAKYPNIFSSFYVSMVKTGEDSGTLDEVLARVAKHREKQYEIISKIKIASVYPIIMFLVGLGTVIFMLTFVMPRLMNIFTNMQSQLPLITQILISASDFLKEKWFIVLGVIGSLGFIYSGVRKRKEYKIVASRVKLTIPLVRDFILKKELARFNRTLEVLIKSGVPILKAFSLAIPIIDNEVIRLEFEKSSKDLEEGASLGASLKKSKILPPFVISLISIGEESGRLGDSLAELADTYENELEEAIKVSTTLLEPLMILVIGLLVGFVVIAMLLPIFQINIMVN